MCSSDLSQATAQGQNGVGQAAQGTVDAGRLIGMGVPTCQGKRRDPAVATQLFGGKFGNADMGLGAIFAAVQDAIAAVAADAISAAGGGVVDVVDADAGVVSARSAATVDRSVP